MFWTMLLYWWINQFRHFSSVYVLGKKKKTEKGGRINEEKCKVKKNNNKKKARTDEKTVEAGRETH